jgi:hypothetical protein
MGDTTWPPELRYRFYRAWNIQMFGLAALALAPAFQFSAAVALVFFVGGGSVMFCGAIMSRSARREADRSTRWRNFTPLPVQVAAPPARRAGHGLHDRRGDGQAGAAARRVVSWFFVVAVGGTDLKFARSQPARPGNQLRGRGFIGRKVQRPAGHTGPFGPGDTPRATDVPDGVVGRT